MKLESEKKLQLECEKQFLYVGTLHYHRKKFQFMVKSLFLAEIVYVLFLIAVRLSMAKQRFYCFLHTWVILKTITFGYIFKTILILTIIFNFNQMLRI